MHQISNPTAQKRGASINEFKRKLVEAMLLRSGHSPKSKFTHADVTSLEASMGRAMVSNRKTDFPLWLQAFEYYNRKHPLNLSINCRPCFGKVFQFIKQSIANE